MDRWLQPALESLVLALVPVLRLHDPPIAGDLRTIVFGECQQAASRGYAPAPVKTVGIEDRSLARLGQRPRPPSRNDGGMDWA